MVRVVVEVPDSPYLLPVKVKEFDGGLTPPTKTKVGTGQRVRHPVAVGIDQSYSGFGLVLLSLESKEYFGWLFKSNSDHAGIRRLREIEFFIYSCLATIDDLGFKVAEVAMEGYAREARNGREEAGELAAIVKRSLNEYYDPEGPGPAWPTIVAPTSLKKFVTGDGRAPKDRMMLSAYKKWGVEIPENNVNDAYGLARIAYALNTGTTEFKYEQDVLSGLDRWTEYTDKTR